MSATTMAGLHPSEAELESQRTAHLRALIVDAHPDTAESLATSLALDGHETRIAASGAEALRIARTFHPQVVLVEAWLPDIDGQEVVRCLRGAPTTQSALLVMITDRGDVEGRERATAAGCDEHLIRPFALDRLAQLEHRAAARAAFLTRGN